MARNFLRRSGLLLRFGESGREIAAAWLLALFIAAASLSVLGIGPYCADDGVSVVATPHIGDYLHSADGPWKDPGFAEKTGYSARPVYSASGNGMRLPLHGADGPQEQRLC
ncbi:MAG: hypothetical protein AB7O13_03430 [Alphaproteobacteria bacterium]